MLAIRYIFISQIPKNQQGFHFQKISEPLKKKKICVKTFLLLQRTIAKKKVWNSVWLSILFRDPQWATLVLPMVNAKTILFSFFSVFAFKNSYASSQPLKMLN